jgi:hypothetical protein
MIQAPQPGLMPMARMQWWMSGQVQAPLGLGKVHGAHSSVRMRRALTQSRVSVAASGPTSAGGVPSTKAA